MRINAKLSRGLLWRSSRDHFQARRLTRLDLRASSEAGHPGLDVLCQWNDRAQPGDLQDPPHAFVDAHQHEPPAGPAGDKLERADEEPEPGRSYRGHFAEIDQYP